MFKNFKQLYDYAKNYLGAEMRDISEKINALTDGTHNYTHTLEVWVITEHIEVLFKHDINAEEELLDVMPDDEWEQMGHTDISDMLAAYEDEIFDKNIGNFQLFIP